MSFRPGATWLWLDRKFSHGLRTAWFRDVVRQRILATRPCDATDDAACEIHALTSTDDWVNLLWSLKSFYEFSRRRYTLCIHEDGSMSDKDVSILEHHFPAARVIRRHVADVMMESVLFRFPRTLAFRRSNVLSTKILDFAAYLESDRMVVFDSDLLFFSEPTIFLKLIEDPGYRRNAFNQDVQTAYTISPPTVSTQIGHEVVERLNSGLGLVHRESIRWDWIEEFLSLPGIVDGHFWQIEQTLFALCSSRFGVDLLPEEYTLRLEPGIGDRCFRHYVGAIRHLMYSEGMAQLTRDGFLRHMREQPG